MDTNRIRTRGAREALINAAVNRSVPLIDSLRNALHPVMDTDALSPLIEHTIEEARGKILNIINKIKEIDFLLSQVTKEIK